MELLKQFLTCGDVLLKGHGIGELPVDLAPYHQAHQSIDFGANQTRRRGHPVNVGLGYLIRVEETIFPEAKIGKCVYIAGLRAERGQISEYVLFGSKGHFGLGTSAARFKSNGGWPVG